MKWVRSQGATWAPGPRQLEAAIGKPFDPGGVAAHFARMDTSRDLTVEHCAVCARPSLAAPRAARARLDLTADVSAIEARCQASVAGRRVAARRLALGLPPAGTSR